VASASANRIARGADDDDAELAAQLLADRDEPSGPVARRKPGRSKKSESREKGGKRAKAFTPPIPLEWQQTPTGYQYYKPKDGLHVYDRRAFEYSDNYKDGDEVTARPVPPSMYDDKYLFQKPKRLLLNTDDDDMKFTPHGQLVQRVSARVVRLTFNHFKGDLLVVETCARRACPATPQHA
jgi:hypothetical protein